MSKIRKLEIIDNGGELFVRILSGDDQLARWHVNSRTQLLTLVSKMFIPEGVSNYEIPAQELRLDQKIQRDLEKFENLTNKKDAA